MKEIVQHRNKVLPHYPKEYALRGLTKFYSFTGPKIVYNNSDNIQKQTIESNCSPQTLETKNKEKTRQKSQKRRKKHHRKQKKSHDFEINDENIVKPSFHNPKIKEKIEFQKPPSEKWSFLNFQKCSSFFSFFL